jgi:hypothetical protein
VADGADGVADGEDVGAGAGNRATNFFARLSNIDQTPLCRRAYPQNAGRDSGSSHPHRRARVEPRLVAPAEASFLRILSRKIGAHRPIKSGDRVLQENLPRMPSPHSRAVSMEPCASAAARPHAAGPMSLPAQWRSSAAQNWPARTRSRTIGDRVTDPSVGRRPVRNDPVSICRHPFLVFGEAPEGLRALTESVDGSQRRGLARKTSELSRFGTVVLGIRHWLSFSRDRRRDLLWSFRVTTRHRRRTEEASTRPQVPVGQRPRP